MSSTDKPVSPPTEIPLSNEEAWLKFWIDAELINGSPTGNVTADMTMAFNAGWQAAIQAMKVAPT